MVIFTFLLHISEVLIKPLHFLIEENCIKLIKEFMNECTFKKNNL